MKTEDHAWRTLNEHAAAQLSPGFADRAIRAAHGPTPEHWRALQAHAARQVRPGFAERVLRAARAFPGNVPSLFDQFALGAATVALCLATVVGYHVHSVRQDEERALASWQQLADATQDIDHGQ